MIKFIKSLKNINIGIIILVSISFLINSNIYASKLINSQKLNSSSLSFIQNKGQWDKSVRYLAELRGLDVWVCKGSIKFEYYVVEKDEDEHKKDEKMQGRNGFPELTEMAEDEMKYSKKSHVIQMDFVDCNDSLQTKGLKRKDAYYNYFIGNDKSKWSTHVPLFEELVIENLYDGIDLKLYFDDSKPDGHAKHLRYDFIVKPGTDPNQIKLRFEGQDEVKINNFGEINIATIFGDVRHGDVFAYQNNETGRIENNPVENHKVSCNITQDGNTISFNTGDYDKTKQLIIDPLVYSTFVGECAVKKCIDLFLKEDHGLFFATSTSSKLYPRTLGAFNTDFSGFVDMGITVFDDKTFAMKFSTYIGSSDLDNIRSISVDSEDNMIIIGSIEESDFPITDNCYQSESSGFTDVAIIKLKSDGTELLYSSYFGGEDLDIPRKSLFVNDNTIYFAGFTLSQDYPTTSSKYSEHKGYFDIFLTKMNISTNEVLFSGLFGGDSEDHINSLEFDQKKNIVFSGYTRSKDFVVTENAYSKTYFGGYNDVYIIKLDKVTHEMITSTYFGGNDTEGSYDILFDKQNNMILSLSSSSTDMPTTEGAYQKNIFPSGKYQIQDCFLAILNEDLNEVKAATYIGGRRVESPACMREYDENSVIICGYTNSENFPTTPDAMDPLKGGDFELMIYIMDKSLEKLHYSTFFGGSFNDYVYEVELNSEKKLYLAGATKSFDYPITEDAFDPTYNARESYYDSFISVLDIPEMYVSINEYSAEDEGMILFPNPTNGLITIKSSYEGSASIEIYNIYGETCIEKHIYHNKDYIKLDISELPVGKYFCRIATSNGLRHGAFIKL